MHGIRNQYLCAWVEATGLSHGEIARRVAAEALRQGHRQVHPDTSRLRRWMEGENPRPPVPQLLLRVLSDAVGEPLQISDLGLAPPVAVVDTVKLPLLATPQRAAASTANAKPDDQAETAPEPTSLAAARAAAALALAVISYHHAVADSRLEPGPDAQELLHAALKKAHTFAECLDGIAALETERATRASRSTLGRLCG